MSKDVTAVLVGLALGLLLFGLFVYAAREDAKRSGCIAAHGVCVDTSDGWKPYDGGEG